MNSDTKFEKVVVDLPNHPEAGGESLWARPLGGDLYELHNSPWTAYDLNYLDVVVATADRADQKPIVRSVHRRSGHRTLRIRLSESLSEDDKQRHLASITALGATYEHADGILYALDIPPSASYDAVCTAVWELEQSGALEYETCEARVAGSFDAAPREVH